jgi:hypothetical protein
MTQLIVPNNRISTDPHIFYHLKTQTHGLNCIAHPAARHEQNSQVKKQWKILSKDLPDLPLPHPDSSNQTDPNTAPPASEARWAV